MLYLKAAQCIENEKVPKAQRLARSNKCREQNTRQAEAEKPAVKENKEQSTSKNTRRKKDKSLVGDDEIAGLLKVLRK